MAGPHGANRDFDTDESTLIWLSTGGEGSLKLASDSKLTPGGKTRTLHPEKDYLSFSLIYNNGKRSLDLICKDKVEAEVWFAGLKALISSEQCGRPKIDGWNDGELDSDDNNDLISISARESSISIILGVASPECNLNPHTMPLVLPYENLIHAGKLGATNMQVQGASSDALRASVSSAPSTSSHGSVQDDCEGLGDVYVWGEVTCDNSATQSADRSNSRFRARTDILLPKPLESSLVLDVHHVSCGVRHAALVTRQGKIFTWGEESGGRLGHGVGTDAIHPHPVESLAFSNADFVACGEFHTCVVSMAGELYTWGDGTYNVGLLGHGTNVSHWIPKRVSGPLEGLQVANVTCGTWHTALITSTGQLFTFGDGTFGVLGHGNRESVSYPREVESLMGLKTVAVACGVWHTAAVVEVIVTQSSASVPSGKLFTWGDGDKYRLGHGDKEPRLKPTCVPSLIEYNFHKLACGHSITVGLTTSGRVFTMGSAVYGQLGNPHSDGKLPCLVEDRLDGEYVSEVACGSYHVVVLTARSEVFTWGKGANGRLGHGDLEDRKTPTVVEALKDRPVKRIACGSNFTAVICRHKWVSGLEQSQCSACRQAFGFTRKRHNCYNCGLVHCHSCSSRKSMGATLSPNPYKPYRVCDTCHLKLNKVLESDAVNNRRNIVAGLTGENRDKFGRVDTKSSKVPLPSNLDLIKDLDIKAAKQGKKTDLLSLIHTAQASSLLQLKCNASESGIDMHGAVPRTVRISATHSINSSRAVSPFSRKPSPPRSATPLPTTSGLSFSKNATDSLKKTNEFLNHEVQKLRAQVDNLRQRCELQEFELKKSAKKAQDAMALASEESNKSKAAKEVIKSLTAQLKDMTERLLPLRVSGTEEMKPVCMPIGVESHPVQPPYLNGAHQLNKDAGYCLNKSLLTILNSTLTDGTRTENCSLRDPTGINESSMLYRNFRALNPNGVDEHMNAREHISGETPSSIREENLERNEPGPLQNAETDSKSGSLIPVGNQQDAEWIEQYEPGVYITLMALPDGTIDLKRVRFSRRRFGEHQAESWWFEYREKVYEKYHVLASNRSPTAPSNHLR